MANVPPSLSLRAIIIVSVGVAPLVLALFGSWILFTDPPTAESPAEAVYAWMELVPTKPAFYYFLAVTVGSYFAWLRLRYYKLEKKSRDRDIDSALETRDWEIVDQLRIRALNLRTRAEVLLLGVVALLGSAGYVLLFVLPQVDPRDQALADARQAQAIFRSSYGDWLRGVSAGRYWFRVAELKDDERITATAFADNGERGLVAGDKGSILVTRDGGESWIVPNGWDVSTFAGLRTVVFDSGSQAGFVVNFAHSALVTQDGGRSWASPRGWSFGENKGIHNVFFGPDGRYGLVVGYGGSILVTQDGGQNWSRPESVPLKTDEGIDRVFFGRGGVALLSGREGSILATVDGGAQWNLPQGLQLEENDQISGVSFGPER